MSILNLNTLPIEDLGEIVSFGGPKFIGKLREIDKKTNDIIENSYDFFLVKSHPVLEKLIKNSSLLKPYPLQPLNVENEEAKRLLVMALRIHFVKTIQQMIQNNRSESQGDFKNLAFRLCSEYNQGNLWPKASPMPAKRVIEFCEENLEETNLGDLFLSCVFLEESNFIKIFDLEKLDKNTIYLSAFFSIIKNDKYLFDELLQHISSDASETCVLETLMLTSIMADQSEMFKDLLNLDSNQEILQTIIDQFFLRNHSIEDHRKLVSCIAKSEKTINPKILENLIRSAIERNIDDETLKDLLELDHPNQEALGRAVKHFFSLDDERGDRGILRLIHATKSKKIMNPNILEKFILVALQRNVKMLPNLLRRDPDQSVLKVVFNQLVECGFDKMIKTLMWIYDEKLKITINSDILIDGLLQSEIISTKTFETILTSIGNTFEDIGALQSTLSAFRNLRDKKVGELKTLINSDTVTALIPDVLKSEKTSGIILNTLASIRDTTEDVSVLRAIFENFLGAAVNDEELTIKLDEVIERIVLIEEWDEAIQRINRAITERAPINYDASQREEAPKRRRLN